MSFKTSTRCETAFVDVELASRERRGSSFAWIEPRLDHDLPVRHDDGLLEGAVAPGLPVALSDEDPKYAD